MHLLLASAISFGSGLVRVAVCVVLGLIVHRLSEVPKDAARWRRYGALTLATFLALWMFVILTQGFPPGGADAVGAY